ncbi:MFS transporter [Lentzea sp. NPDC051838]|uniref:MFS transporter n=1 Tax=Lentzea sp. NPDC051838 TaxID=3154849 RepID=UPI003420A593
MVHSGATLRLAFLSAVVSLTAAFAASAAPIPLFNTYRAEDGFTNFDISLAVVSYGVPTLVALLVMGRLSSHLGRRRTSLASLGLLALGCLLLLNVHDVGTLLAGRALMGLGAGLAGSNVTAYVVDAAPSKPAWLASVASSQTPMIGLAIGAIASGALVQFGPWPRQLIYLAAVGFLLLSAALIALSPETVPPTPGAWRSLRPSVTVPARVRRLLPVATAVFLSTWATGAFYQAFVPALAEEQLHTRSPLVLGLVFAAYMAPSALGAPLGGRFTPATAQRLGMVAFLAGMIGIITAIATSTLASFIAATVVAGASQGIAISASTRCLLHESTPAERAPIFSVIYLICYSAAAFPSLVAGRLSTTFSLPQIALGYGGLALAATVFTLIAARNPRARFDRLLATQESLLTNLHSLRDLVHWRDEVVLLAQRGDNGTCPLGELADLLANGDEAGRSTARAIFTAWESLLAGGLTRVRDSGELAPDADPQRLATGLMAALQGGLLLTRTTRDVRQLEVALDQALGYVRAVTR